MVSGGLTDKDHVLTGRFRIAWECMLLLLGKRKRYKISNNSMVPSAYEGDFVLVNINAFKYHAPRVGEMIVTRHPRMSSLILIKRVKKVENDLIHVASDNPYVGEDSRHFGPLKQDLLVGQVTAIIS